MIGLGFRTEKGKNQVFVRSMLFATGKRGGVVENMYTRVRHGERAQNFSIWVHGNAPNMTRGAGLHVGEAGVTANFHFLLRPDEQEFEVTAGTYSVELFARVLGHKGEVKISVSEVDVTPSMLGMRGGSFGIQFDWAPDSGRYVGHPSAQGPRISPEELERLVTQGITRPGVRTDEIHP